MASVQYTVRRMTAEDVPRVLECWKEIELAEGTHTLYSWLQVDKDAINVAVTDEGEVIGVCSAVLHEDADFHFVGMYIVKEKYRGTGIGKKVWDACQDHIGHRNAVINAVPDKTELYKTKGGFPIEETSWSIVVHQTYDSVDPKALSDKVPEGVAIHPFQESHLSSMHQYDLSLVGYKRNLALELSCREEGSRTFVAEKDGKCVGFGSIRTSIQNWGQVGPLYADDSDVAEVLLRYLLESLPQAKGMAMMTNSTNKHASDFLRKVGCPVLEECPRLYRSKKLDVDVSKVFAHWNCNFSHY